MEYSNGECVMFYSEPNRKGQKFRLKGLIIGFEPEYKIYTIKSINDNDYVRIHFIDENDILYSLNEHVLRWRDPNKELPPGNDNFTWVLVSVLNKSLGDPITLPALYDKDDKLFDIDGVNYPLKDIIAWMPLPDPYKHDDSKRN